MNQRNHLGKFSLLPTDEQVLKAVESGGVPERIAGIHGKKLLAEIEAEKYQTTTQVNRIDGEKLP